MSSVSQLPARTSASRGQYDQHWFMTLLGTGESEMNKPEGSGSAAERYPGLAEK